MDDVKTDIVEEVRRKANIVDVISEYIPLSKNGKNYVGVCPFHDDSNPSMFVSPDKQIFKCFACGVGGNVFNFVMNYEHLSFKETLKLLGDKFGIDTKVNIGKKTESDPSLEAYEIVTKYYENSLFTNKGVDALKYLNGRSISDEIIREFRIGYSPNEDVATKMLVSKHFSYDMLVNIGITTKTDYGYRDFFFNRIMFPICDHENRVVACSGRIFNGEKTSKYINTKETKHFRKGSILYNYYRAKEYALKEKSIIITEGFFDVIRCYTAGFKNVIATMGTAVTEEHVKAIRKLSTNIILLFDGDNAGAKATYSCGNILMKNGIVPKVVRLGEYDPDEYILKFGPEGFKTIMSHPISFMEFKLDYLKQNRDMTKIADLSSYVNDVIEEINKMDDLVLRDITIDKISRELGIDKSIITSRLENNQKKEKKVIQPKVKKLNKYDKASYKIIYYMLNSEDIINIYQNRGIVFNENIYRDLANEILYFYKNNGKISSADLISYLNEKKELVDIIVDVESMNYDEKYNIEEIEDCINLLKKYAIQKELDISKKAEILNKILELKKREL